MGVPSKITTLVQSKQLGIVNYFKISVIDFNRIEYLIRLGETYPEFFTFRCAGRLFALDSEWEMSHTKLYIVLDINTSVT